MSEQDNDEIFGNNSPDDICWLYSLSDSELEFLISLKMLAIHRAKVIGHEDLADKFDLKMLRALGLVLTEYLNGCCENTSAILFLIDSSTLLDGSNLLMNLKDSFASVKSEDIRELIDTQSKKRTIERAQDETVLGRTKKRKTEGS